MSTIITPQYIEKPGDTVFQVEINPDQSLSEYFGQSAFFDYEKVATAAAANCLCRNESQQTLVFFPLRGKEAVSVEKLFDEYANRGLKAPDVRALIVFVASSAGTVRSNAVSFAWGEYRTTCFPGGGLFGWSSVNVCTKKTSGFLSTGKSLVPGCGVGSPI